MSTKFSLKLDYLVYANPDQVFEALTNPGIISTWGGGFSVVEEKVGGVFELFDGWVKGEVTIYEPGKELGYTWRPEVWSKNTIPSKVNIFVSTPFNSEKTWVSIQNEECFRRKNSFEQ